MEEIKCSLRERKHAKMKLAIMSVFVGCLEKSRFEDISIREICRRIDISEGTFFNYFPEKIDIINYYMHLRFLAVIWKARNDVPRGLGGLALIDAVFQRITEELNNPNAFYQMISVLLIQKTRPKEVSIPDIEKRIAFPNYEGIENIASTRIEDFLEQCLKEAAGKGDLPRDVKIDDVLVSLMAILGGTLLAIKFVDIEDREYHYERQLKLLWKGLGVRKMARIK
ncbi:MAG: TetR/AcrR family transcriptional regulator [Candidatus Omnitrophota bacterium]|jgi:AcrR family transcriptional regulator